MCAFRGVLNEVLYGEALPRGPTPYPFILHFWQKREPFCIPSVKKWHTFNIPSLELCISSESLYVPPKY